MQRPAVAVPTEASYQLEAGFLFRCFLHRSGPVEKGAARLHHLDPRCETVLPRVHQGEILWIGVADRVGPGGISDPTFVKNADVYRKDVALLQRGLGHVMGSVHDAVVHRKTGVRWKAGVRSRLVPKKSAFTLQVLERVGDEGVDLAQRLSRLEPLHQTFMNGDHALGRSSCAIYFRL